MNDWLSNWLSGIDADTAISAAAMVPGPIGAVAGTAEGIKEIRSGRPWLGAATIGLSLAGLGMLRKAGKAAKAVKTAVPALRYGPAPVSAPSRLAQLADDAERLVEKNDDIIRQTERRLRPRPRLAQEIDLAGQKIAKYTTHKGDVNATYSMRPDGKIEVINIGSPGGDNSIGFSATRGILDDLLARNKATGVYANRIAGANPRRTIDKTVR